MFENLPRQISIPIEVDEQGYVDKECPATSCIFTFKIHQDDWRNIVRNEEVFCPRCGHVAPAKNWFTTDQIEKAKEQALDVLQGYVREALNEFAQDLNRSVQSNSFVKISMQVSGDTTKPVIVPITASEPMTMKAICTECHCRYGFIGAAFFCPSCGHNSAEQTFRQSLGIIRATLANEERLREVLDRDTAENTIRALRENAIEDTVTSFQRVMECMYMKLLETPSAAPKNAFQRLQQGNDLWKASAGKSYEEVLTVEESNLLKMYFQQRHVLSHREGIIDQEYLNKSGDSAYRVGQRLIVKRQDVIQFVDTIEKLVRGLQGQA